MILGRVARESGELRLEGEDMVVPAPGVRVFLGRRRGLDLLEDLYIGLRGTVAVFLSVLAPQRTWTENVVRKKGDNQRCDKRLDLYSDSGVLSRLINTDQRFSSGCRRCCGGARRHGKNCGGGVTTYPTM